MTDEDDIRTVHDTVEAIRPHLAGKGPHIQGAVVADLMAIYLAAHAPQVREAAREAMMKTIDRLIVENERIFFPDGKHPFSIID